MAPSVEDRIVFWQGLRERLAKLSMHHSRKTRSMTLETTEAI
jgi:hypothetical protein